jgi:hypothetical protein
MTTLNDYLIQKRAAWLAKREAARSRAEYAFALALQLKNRLGHYAWLRLRACRHVAR